MECELCHKQFKSLTSLSGHKLKYHANSCAHCPESFASKSALKQHLTTHGFVCQNCCEVFATKERLEQHMQDHLKDLRCELCDKEFSTASACKVHVKRVHFADVECGKSDKNFTSQAGPKALDEGQKSMLVCDACGKSYTSLPKLRNHIMYDHQHEQKPHQCGVCSKRFTSRRDLVRHLERHSAEPKHSCQECHKKFFTRNDMRRHFKVVHEKYHAGSCEICGRKFQSVGGKEWTQHMNTHAGIK